MSLQLRRGTAAEVATIVPIEGEPIYVTDTKELNIGDGSTVGGVRVSLNAANLGIGTVAENTNTTVTSLFDKSAGKVRLSNQTNSNSVTVGSTGTQITGPLNAAAVTLNSLVFTADGQTITSRSELVGAQGAQGYQGVTGAQGSQGATGSQGAQGAQGAQGHQGQVGAQGAQGFQGIAGTQGAQGHQGQVGAQGAQGYQGPMGNANADQALYTTSSVAFANLSVTSTATLGSLKFATRDFAIGIDSSFTADPVSEGNIAIGAESVSAGTHSSIALGARAEATGGNASIAVGYGATSEASNSIAVGYAARAIGNGEIAIGKESGSAGTNSITIGNNPFLGAGQNNVIVINASNQAINTMTNSGLYMAPIADKSNNVSGNLLQYNSTSKEISYINNPNRENSVTGITTTTAQTIFTFDPTQFDTAKLVIAIKDAGEYHASEVLVTSDGTDIWSNEYSVVTSNGELGTLSTRIFNSLVEVRFTATAPTSMNIKVAATLLAV